MNHVKNCDKLEGGEYYCAEHAVTERFALPSTDAPTLSIKLSVIVRRSIRIIRKLGSRRSKEANTAELEDLQVLPPGLKADHFLLTTEEDLFSKHAEAELASRAREPIELSATLSQYLPYTEIPAPVQTFSDSASYNDQPRFHNSEPGPQNHDPELLPSVTDAMDVDTPNNIEFVSARSILSLGSSYEYVDSKTPSPTSPFSESSEARTSQYDGERSETEFTPPTSVSTTLDPESSSAVFPESSWVTISQEMSCFDHEMISELANRNYMPPPAAAQGEPEASSEKIVCAVDYDAELHRKVSGNKLPEQFKILEQSMEVFSQCSLVEGLRRVSEVLYKRSIRNLSRNPMPYKIKHFIYEMPPPEQIAEKGLATLSKVFSGNLPSTLMEVYTMIHVVYVVAIVINQKELAEVQDELYADIYNWSLAIKSSTDRALFVDIASRIWTSEHSNTKCPRDAISGLSGTPNQACFTSVLPPVNGSPFSSSSKWTGSKALGLGIGSREHDALLQVLKEGTAIYLCRQYMDSKCQSYIFLHNFVAY